MKSKHLKFEVIEGEWTVINKKQDEPLGHFEYFKRWKKWVFVPYDAGAFGKVYFSKDCLESIIKFMDTLAGKSEPEKPYRIVKCKSCPWAYEFKGDILSNTANAIYDHCLETNHDDYKFGNIKPKSGAAKKKGD